MKKTTFLVLALGIVGSANADLVFHNLSSSNFSQDWSNAGLISTSDDWSGVSSVMGYRGDNLTATTGVDPQTVTADETTVDVNANQTNPDTFTTGGVAEFAITNPVVALNGSGTADAPFLLFSVNAASRTGVTISYTLRDLDASVDNSIQQVALQYRLGNSGVFTNVAGGYVADATAGPSLATLTTPVSATLGAWDNASQLQFRVITTNALGNDEWVGVDDISITSSPVPEPASMIALALGGLGVLRRKKK